MQMLRKRSFVNCKDYFTGISHCKLQYQPRVRVPPLARSKYSLVRASQSEYTFRLATREYSNFVSLASIRDSKLSSATSALETSLVSRGQKPRNADTLLRLLL